MSELDDRRTELKRQADTQRIELACIGLEPECSITFNIRDAKTINRIYSRISRLSGKCGRKYNVSVGDNNTVTIKRFV